MEIKAAMGVDKGVTKITKRFIKELSNPSRLLAEKFI